MEIQEKGAPHAGAKLIVLDGFALNPGDLSWDPLYKLAAPLIRERTAESEIVGCAAEAAILLTNKTLCAARRSRRCRI